MTEEREIVPQWSLPYKIPLPATCSCWRIASYDASKKKFRL